MKDLRIFNKFFFVLCSSFLIALTSPSVAEEPKYHTIQGHASEYEVFGTEQEAQSAQRLLSHPGRTGDPTAPLGHFLYSLKNLYEARDKHKKNEKIPTWDKDGKKQMVNAHTYYGGIIENYKEMIKAEEQKITTPMGEKREKNYKERKARQEQADRDIAFVRRMEAQAAKKKAEEEAATKKKAKEEAAKVAAAAAAKVDAAEAAAAEAKEAAKVAAEREKERERLAEAKKIAEVKERAAFAERRAKKLADEIKMAQDIAADKARRLREYEKNKAISVASIVLSLQDEFNKGPKNPNIIKSVTEDGIVRTLYCNPGPCTPGSVILHGNISGIDMGVPVNEFAKQLRVFMAHEKPGANFTVGDHLKLIDPLRVFNYAKAKVIRTFNYVEDNAKRAGSAAESDEPNDINLTRALSIPKNQVEKNKQAHIKLIDSSHDNDVNPLQLGGCWWC